MLRWKSLFPLHLFFCRKWESIIIQNSSPSCRLHFFYSSIIHAWLCYFGSVLIVCGMFTNQVGSLYLCCWNTLPLLFPWQMRGESRLKSSPWFLKSHYLQSIRAQDKFCATTDMFFHLCINSRSSPSLRKADYICRLVFES